VDIDRFEGGIVVHIGESGEDHLAIDIRGAGESIEREVRAGRHAGAEVGALEVTDESGEAEPRVGEV